MATSPHPAATEAGAHVLRNGGNAIEAAVATGAVLAVVYPHFCGLGGDAVWMVADAQGKASCFLGVGQATGSIHPEEFDGPIPVRGPRSALTTAGVVDSWGHALEFARDHWEGNASLAELLGPATELAASGYPVSKSQVFWLDLRRDEAPAWPGFAEVFMPDGRAPGLGENLRQPRLADSLRAIAREGAREFYEGALAARIAAGLMASGSPLTAADLAATRTRTVAPLSLGYRDCTLFAPPPPTQGVTTLMAMGVLGNLPLQGHAEGSAGHLHLVVEAIKQAFLLRDGLADPDNAEIDVAGLLDPARLAELAQQIDVSRALPWPHVHRTGDTVFFGAVDAQGRCASVLQSIYFDWGSGVVAGDTGILWHNRGAAFSAIPGHCNLIAPGKRPFMTLNPGLATRSCKPSLVYGTQGADGQPQTLALLLTRMIDFGLEPADALRRPRFLLGKTFSDSRDSLKIERDAGEDVLERLAGMGHQIAPIGPQSPLAGQAGIIAVSADGDLSGAHDPRGEGATVKVDI